MCYKYVDGNVAGISSHAKRFVNSSWLGQCSCCWINIPEGHPCGITPEGELVCFAYVKSYNAKHEKEPFVVYKYSPALASSLVFIKYFLREEVAA